MSTVNKKKRTAATHEDIVTILPDIGWEAFQQIEPIVLALPKCIQNRSLQCFAHCRKCHYGGLGIQRREDTCDGLDDTFLLKESGDSTPLRSLRRAEVGWTDDLVAGVGHIRRTVVVDGCEHMGFDSQG